MRFIQTENSTYEFMDRRIIINVYTYDQVLLLTLLDMLWMEFAVNMFTCAHTQTNTF